MRYVHGWAGRQTGTHSIFIYSFSLLYMYICIRHRSHHSPYSMQTISHCMTFCTSAHTTTMVCAHTKVTVNNEMDYINEIYTHTHCYRLVPLLTLSFSHTHTHAYTFIHVCSYMKIIHWSVERPAQWKCVCFNAQQTRLNLYSIYIHMAFLSMNETFFMLHIFYTIHIHSLFCSCSLFLCICSCSFIVRKNTSFQEENCHIQ